MINLPADDPASTIIPVPTTPSPSQATSPTPVVVSPESVPVTPPKKGKSKMIIVGLVVLFVLVLAGLVGFFVWQRSKDGNTQETDNSSQIVIGFSMGTLQEERWQRDRDEFLKETEAKGVALNLLSSNNNAELQLQQARSLIEQGVDVLVIAPYDADSIAPAVSEAQAAGIKVISYDRLIRGAQVDLYVSFDNKEVGRQEAQGVINVVNRGKFAYIGGSLTDNNALLLKEGSMEVLQPYIDRGEIKLVYEEFTANWEPENAYDNLKGYLLKNPQVDAVVAANDGTAFGSIRALSEFGLDGKVPVSGQDAELGACQRVVEGTQALTVYKPIPQLAKSAVELAIKLAKGENLEITDYVSNGESEVPSYLIKPVMVTKENMMETVIKDQYHSFDEVYVNIPSDLRPKQ